MSGVYFVKFIIVIFLLSPFEKLHHSLFRLSILFLTLRAAEGTNGNRISNLTHSKTQRIT